MSTYKLCVVAVTVPLLLLACSNRTHSTLLANDIDIHNDIVQQTNSMPLSCPASAMVIFIGSSENTSVIDHWNIASPDQTALEQETETAAKRFAAAITTAKNGLLSSLGRDPNCGEGFEIGLVSIVDGHRSGDSSIESYRFAKVSKDTFSPKVWKRIGKKSWSFDGSALSQISEASGFELNMARDVGKIVDLFAKNTLAVIDGSKKITAGNAIAYAQMSYVIKTHGTRIATNPRYVPTLANLLAYPRSQLTAEDWEPAIFIDTNGRNGPVTSNVYSVHWNPDDVKKTLATAGDGNATSGDGNATSGDGNATSGDGNATSGDGNATSGELADTAGSKALAFKEAIVPSAGGFDFLGKKLLGAFATYPARNAAENDASKDINESIITFPVAANNNLTANKPKNLVILDSCYGSEKILRALRYDGASGANTVVLASTNELYYEFLDYSQLSLSGFFKFPALLEKLKKGRNLSDAEQQLLKNMSEGTLVWKNDETSTGFKKMEIWLD